MRLHLTLASLLGGVPQNLVFLNNAPIDLAYPGGRLPMDHAEALVYRLSPNLVLEYFEDEALALLATQDCFVRVNKAGADLIRLVQAAFAAQSFSDKDLEALLANHFELAAEESCAAAQRILMSWVEHGILIRVEGAVIGGQQDETFP